MATTAAVGSGTSEPALEATRKRMASPFGSFLHTSVTIAQQATTGTTFREWTRGFKMLPVPPPEEKPGVKASDTPDLFGAVALIPLWVLLFTFGPLVWYSPPRLKPRWLHLVA